MKSSSIPEAIPSAVLSEDAEIRIPALPTLDGGFTRLPNVLVDIWQPKLPLTQFALLLYLIRQTLGFNRPSVAISASRCQLESGVTHRTTWLTAREGLVDRGLINIEHTVNDRGGSKPTIYWINWPVLLTPPRAAHSSCPASGPGRPASPTSAGKPFERSAEARARPALVPPITGAPRSVPQVTGGRSDSGGGTSSETGRGGSSESGVPPRPVSELHERKHASKENMKDSSKETPVMPRPAPAPTPQPTHAAAVQDVSSEDEQKTSAVTTLESFGLSRADAVAIVSQHGAGHVVERVNALGPRARSAKNPPGFIRSSMGWPLARVPEPQERAEDAVKATRVKIASQQAMQAAHATWRATVDARLAELDPETEAELFEQAESRATSVYGRASHTLVQVAMRELVAERFGIEMPVDERSEKWP